MQEFLKNNSKFIPVWSTQQQQLIQLIQDCVQLCLNSTQLYKKTSCAFSTKMQKSEAYTDVWCKQFLQPNQRIKEEAAWNTNTTSIQARLKSIEKSSIELMKVMQYKP